MSIGLSVSIADGKQEGISRVIDLKEDEPSNVEKMLQFIYTGDYSDLSSDDPDTPILASAMVNVEIYAIAEKYDIRTLKELAKKKFESSVDFSNANMSDVSIIIEFVYRTTPSSDRGLRDIIAPYLTSLKTELRASDDFMDLIKNKLDGDFAIDVIEAWVSSKASQGSTYGRDPTAGPCCPVCKGVLLFCKSRYRYVAWTWSAGEPCCSCGVKHIDTFCANCPGNRTLLDRIALIYGRGM